MCIIGLFLVLILLYVVLIKTGIMQSALQDFQTVLKRNYKTNKVKVVSIIFVIMLCVILFGLPAHMLFSIFSSLVIEEKWLAYFVLLTASVVGSFIVYLFC